DLRTALSPLADAYQGWCDALQGQLGSLSNRYQATGAEHLNACRETLHRIREGVDLLVTDTSARLAFCFANKAIALQSAWLRKRVDAWHPFQLAFQLLNLPAIRDDRSRDRQTCDLLWVPTGGGKTEAYLGLAAFTFALRRLTTREAGTAQSGLDVSVLSRYTLRLLTIQQFRRALALVT